MDLIEHERVFGDSEIVLPALQPPVPPHIETCAFEQHDDRTGAIQIGARIAHEYRRLARRQSLAAIR
jgi:hypothetical protein